MSIHRRGFVTLLASCLAVVLTSVRSFGQTRFGGQGRFGAQPRFGNQSRFGFGGSRFRGQTSYGNQSRFGGPTGTTRVSAKQYRGSGRVASLGDQLKAGLRARRQVEFKFIDDVVQLVETKKLPVKLVVETFDYARKKRTNHPFQYFQRALVLRAARLGIKLTPV